MNYLETLETTGEGVVDVAATPDGAIWATVASTGPENGGSVFFPFLLRPRARIVYSYRADNATGAKRRVLPATPSREIGRVLAI